WVEIDLLHLGVGTHHGMNSGENGSSASNDQQAMGRWGLWSGYVVKINLSPFSFMIGQGILLNLKTKFPENCL
ncbi:hypothetical protein, partial [Pseudomonas aeruginosa]|uniref:hypothetical protein n=1 Tax=Pseudomonas aeruginosa TaxID=287 RepID=UPI003528D87B